MLRTASILVCTLLFSAPSLLTAQAAHGPSPDNRITDSLIRDNLPRRLQYLETQVAPAVAKEKLHAFEAMLRLYEGREQAPLWLVGAEPSSQAFAAARLLGHAKDHGLEPDDYHHRTIVALLEVSSQGLGFDALLDLELLLSEGLLHYGAHLLSGRLRAGLYDQELGDFRHELDLIPIVEKAAAGMPDVVWHEVEPDDAHYRQLQTALRVHRGIVDRGGWPDVPEGRVLKPGFRAPETRLTALRDRLIASGDLDPSEPFTRGLYDRATSEGVKRFQTRHGLSVDGALGPRTAAALAVTASERLSGIETNLERFRWLPRNLGRRHIIVNIPAQELDYVEEDRTTLEMRVIVGRADRPTAIFSDRIRYLVFRPYWEVPFNLAVEDELPDIKKDIGHIARRNFQVLQGWDESERLIDPKTIDWASLDRDDFPYRLRQRPGKGNALGRLKFMFPNAYSVYLHDTPSRDLFERNERQLSSGCVRVERPIELAGEVLEGTPLWDRWLIDKTIASNEQYTVPLLEPIPIHLVYFTAWPDEDGRIGFLEDIYDLDPGVRSDLDRSTATSTPWDRP